VEGLSDVVAPVEQARSLPPRCYVNGRHFEWEMQGVFRSGWCGVGRVDRVAETGTYCAFELAGVPVLMVRDENGELRAFSNSCRHRGMKIAADGEGKCKTFMCPFHAWTYGLDGRLISCPRMEGVDEFSKDDYGLVPIRCEIRQGFVFLNMDGNGPDIDTWLGDFATLHAPWSLEDLVTSERSEFDVHCNWKAVLEVFNEYYHLSAVHSDTVAGSYATPEPLDSVTGDYSSQFGAHKENARGGILEDDRESEFPVIETLSGATQNGTRYSWIFPSMTFAASCDAIWVLEAYPQSPALTRVAMSVCFPQQTTALADFAPRAAAYHRRMEAAMAEDVAILEQQQLGLSSPLAKPGPFAPRLEASVHAFQFWLAERLLSLSGDPDSSDAHS